MKTYLLGIAAAAMFCVGNIPSAQAVVLDPSDPDFVLWLKADVGVEEADGDSAENNDAVSRWLDQSGKGNHVTQATLANRPIFTAVDVQINNQPSVTFDGSNDVLANAGLNPSFGFSIFAVTKSSGPDDTFRGYLGGGSNTVAFGKGFIPDNSFMAWTPSGSGVTYGSENSLDTDYHVQAYSIPSNSQPNWIWYLDGTLISGTGLAGEGTADYATGTRVGYTGNGSEYWGGPIAELIIFDRVLSASEINEVGYYLGQKYGIQTAFVPEPSSALLLAIGFVAIVSQRRRTR